MTSRLLFIFWAFCLKRGRHIADSWGNIWQKNHGMNYFSFRDIERQSWIVHPNGLVFLNTFSVSFFLLRKLGRSYWAEIWWECVNNFFLGGFHFFSQNSNFWQNGGHFSLKSKFLGDLHYIYDFHTFYSFFELSAWNLVGI